METPTGIYYSVSKQTWHITGPDSADKDYDDLGERATFSEALALAKSSGGMVYIDEVDPSRRANLALPITERGASRIICKVFGCQVMSGYEAKVQECLARAVNV